MLSKQSHRICLFKKHISIYYRDFNLKKKKKDMNYKG